MAFVFGFCSSFVFLFLKKKSFFLHHNICHLGQEKQFYLKTLPQFIILEFQRKQIHLGIDQKHFDTF